MNKYSIGAFGLVVSKYKVSISKSNYYALQFTKHSILHNINYSANINIVLINIFQAFDYVLQIEID